MKRTVTFTIKGNTTQIEVESDDLRPDSQIIREYRHRRKGSILFQRSENKRLKLAKNAFGSEWLAPTLQPRS
jgi:hypothetical protein